MLSFCLRVVTLSLLALPLLTAAAAPAQAQTYTVIHTFTGGDDGGNPRTGGLLIDAAGNLYGGTEDGGLYRADCISQGCGVIFRLSPGAGDWVFSTLYSFQGGSDGYQPDQVLRFGPDGSLYGTTYFGGSNNGTVFRLQPPITACKTSPSPGEKPFCTDSRDRLRTDRNPSAAIWFSTAKAIYTARRTRVAPASQPAPCMKWSAPQAGRRG